MILQASSSIMIVNHDGINCSISCMSVTMVSSVHICLICVHDSFLKNDYELHCVSEIVGEDDAPKNLNTFSDSQEPGRQ